MAIAGASSINSILSPPATSGGSSSSLGQNDFMKLLVTQLKNQNPLDPVTGSDFVAQLAQFSSLSGIQQMNTNFQSLLLLQGLTQGSQLIGSTITYQQSSGSMASGRVQAVTAQNGTVSLQVNGALVPLQQVRSVNSTPTSAPKT